MISAFGVEISQEYSPRLRRLLPPGRAGARHVVAVAILHDVLEDTSADRSELDRRFGSKVSERVALGSDDQTPRPIWWLRKASFVILHANMKATQLAETGLDTSTKETR